MPNVTATGELTTLHIPLPTAGKLPFKLIEVAQVFWFAPAFATVGKVSRVIVTVLSLGAQTPFEIVHLKV
ncbi:MAG: hypothetical protein EAY75_05510 [Bacteroidetes bacterium]|nr:MAG: hypothetical protein EAY75_05510 [Bacteroidota bacterium]